MVSHPNKSHCQDQCEGAFFLYFLLQVSGLRFKPLIHLKLIFESNVKQGSNFNVLHVVMQCSQHHFPCGVFSVPVSKVRRLCKWGSVSVPLVLFHWSVCPVFMPVPHCFDSCSLGVQFEVRKHNASRFALLSRDFFGYSGSFVFPYTF